MISDFGCWSSCAASLLLTFNLAALDWHNESGFRWAALNPEPSTKAGFTLLPPDQTGLTFTNTLGEWEGAANRVLFNGSGVAVGDFDNDGLPDIFLCGLDTPNALYKNLGNWRFKDITKAAGLEFTGKNFRGAVLADVNGDGWLDLLVATTGRGVLCYLNDGAGKFRNATEFAGTGSSYGSVTLALADVDGNGTLDLYVANNRPDDIRDRGQVDVMMSKGKLVIPPEFKDRLVTANGAVLEYGQPDQLFLNDGKGHFTLASWTDGTFVDEEGRRGAGPPLDWGLTATFRDLNGDGFPDIYVCNDYWTPDRIWINDGKGHFRAIPKLALRNTSASSMGVDFADVDRDGHLDFFVVDMLSRDPRLRKRQMPAQKREPHPVGLIDNRPQFMRNTFFHNRGDNTFEELANYAGLAAADWAWSPVFVDVDLDGYPDLLITAGHAKDVQDMDAARAIEARQRSYDSISDPMARQEAFTRDKMINGRLYPRLDMPIIAYRNLGNLKFGEVTGQWGTDHLGVHHGIAFADFDLDGDLDFVVNNLGAPAGLYRNNVGAPRVAVRLKGLPPNTQAVGARVQLHGGAAPNQSEEIISGGRYMAGSNPEVVFAAHPSSAMKLQVRWRSGKETIVTNVFANRVYEILEAAAGPAMSSPPPPASTPLFEDVSAQLKHRHRDAPFDDFARQPLLPFKLSQLGPGVAWGDLNHDDLPDLIVGGGKDGTLSILLNRGTNGFEGLDGPILSRDQAGILAVPSDGGDLIMAALANYEDGQPSGSAVQLWDLGKKTASEIAAGSNSSPGPLALGDPFGDGTLVLFVGGRVIPGHYPKPADSHLYVRKGTEWELFAPGESALKGVGLVSGAVWSDLDGDGFSELLLACDWGPIRVFRVTRGVVSEQTASLGLQELTGRWNGITTGDFDGDGRTDIVASNWGLNTPWSAPVSLYYGDLAGLGSTDVLETELDSRTHLPAPSRRLDVLSAQFPFLSERFPTFKGFSEASVSEAFKDELPRLKMVQAKTLASILLLNRGGSFLAANLPKEAQFAPSFSVNVADFNGDGVEDLFLSQNFFATEPEIPRLDAGLGLLLTGEGNGAFKAVSPLLSGLYVYGEQRGAAVADFNQDGRPDLAISQNGSVTKLYVNRSGKPGVRIRLQGSPGNERGIGAILRLKSAGRWGPAREIHCGSGFWSQDSLEQILAGAGQLEGVQVRWPGGKVTESPVPRGALGMIIPIGAPDHPRLFR